MQTTDTPRPALRWALRALPLVAFVAVGLITKSTLAALIGLAVGWIAAVILGGVWWATRTKAPTAGPVGTLPAPLPAPAEAAEPAEPVQSERPGAGAFPRAAATPQLVGPIDVPIEARELEQAEHAARTHSGFLAGYYALVDGHLMPTLWPPRAGEDVIVRIEADQAQDRDEYASGRWTRRLAPHEVTATYDYRARARHFAGAVLELRSFRTDRIYAEWHRVQDGEPNPNDSIPKGFTWEKNDDYYRGWVDPGDLTDIRDDRQVAR